MEIKDIEHLAALARIEITEAEKKSLVGDLDNILRFVGQIQEASTETTENTAGIPKNVLRDDGEPHAKGIYTEAFLAAAPERKGNYVKVKNIL